MLSRRPSAHCGPEKFWAALFLLLCSFPFSRPFTSSLVVRESHGLTAIRANTAPPLCVLRPALTTQKRGSGLVLSAKKGKKTKRQPKENLGFGKAATASREIPQNTGDSLTLEQLHAALHYFRQEFEQMFQQEDVAATDGRGLSGAQLARERVLCSRLDKLALKRTRISTDGAVSGAGLFATRDIAEGEVITCYPGDALVYSIPGTGDDAIIFGWHVPADLADPARCFDDWVDYGLFEDDEYAVIGIPEVGADVAYAGHFCNDGAMLLEDGREAEVEYEASTALRRNALHTDLDSLHMVTVATRDIVQGEEVLVSYGVDYWREFAERSRLSSKTA